MASRCAMRSSPRARRAEEFVRESRRAGVGWASQHILGFAVVQRVVKARDGTRRVAERRMRGNVLDALAVDIDFAAVAQAFKVFGAGEWPAFGAYGVFASD